MSKFDVPAFIKNFNTIINKKNHIGFLKKEYFTTTDFNEHFEVHSRILPLICSVCKDMEYETEIERNYPYEAYDNDKKRTFNKPFKPDISVFSNDKLTAFIEYESTNSSDLRFIDIDENYGHTKSDLRHFKGYMADKNTTKPFEWIIISTLPSGRVDRTWYSHDYRKIKNKKEYQHLISSPLNHFKNEYEREARTVFRILNVNGTTLRMLNIDGFCIDTKTDVVKELFKIP